MEPIEIIKLAVEVRNAQKDYWKFRTTSALNKAKQLEKRFDKIADEFLNPSKQLCFENFNTQPAPWLDLPIEPLN